MIATQSQGAKKKGVSLITADAPKKSDSDEAIKLKNLNNNLQLFLPHSIITHHPKAGINPLVDAASYLFSAIGKLKNLKVYRQLNSLQKDLIEAINNFYAVSKNQGYNPEYLIICRYIFCAVLDDIINNTAWGGVDQWKNYSLLSAFNQDPDHHDKFFNILDHAIKEPHLYIDLMELIYLCLSLGYKGKFRATEHGQYQLEQIHHHLYNHIRTYRGNFSKVLSPKLRKINPKAKKKTANSIESPLLTLILTASVIMIIFISLAYLMDVFANETFKQLTEINLTASSHINKT